MFASALGSLHASGDPAPISLVLLVTLWGLGGTMGGSPSGVLFSRMLRALHSLTFLATSSRSRWSRGTEEFCGAKLRRQRFKFSLVADGLFH